MYEKYGGFYEDSGYHIDLVMCIDGTASMKPFIDEVKANALSFYKMVENVFDENDAALSQFRVKIIVFGDCATDEGYIKQSDFFVLPHQNEDFAAFVNGIEATGTCDRTNSLEAIALALKSDWIKGRYKKRHDILVFTDKAAIPLGERASCKGYPADMPKTLEELNEWWEGKTMCGSTYNPRVGRLVVFVPEVYPWVDLQMWNRYWPVYSKAGTGLDDVDIQNAIDIMVCVC